MDTFRALVDTWIAATRAEIERCIGALPDGTYRGASRVQYKPGAWADVAVSVDVSGTSPQTESYVNAPWAVTHMGVHQCMAMLLASVSIRRPG